MHKIRIVAIRFMALCLALVSCTTVAAAAALPGGGYSYIGQVGMMGGPSGYGDAPFTASGACWSAAGSGTPDPSISATASFTENAAFCSANAGLDYYFEVVGSGDAATVPVVVSAQENYACSNSGEFEADCFAGAQVSVAPQNSGSTLLYSLCVFSNPNFPSLYPCDGNFSLDDTLCCRQTRSM